MLPNWVVFGLDILATVFVTVVGFIVLALVVLYIYDRVQTKHTVLRNYPVIGHFRYLFEHLGEFFRQYFFAMDREELPFNRSQRSWVYRAAKNEDNTVAFGSTRDLRPAGTPMFVSDPYPTLDEDGKEPGPVTIGPYCREPYTTESIFNISGMSYGALSKVAVTALSHGAKLGGVWYNTGEGGLSSFHLAGDCDIVFQIGTAKYGCRDENGHLSQEKLKDLAAKPQIKMFEVKLSQGAKPGKGGMLPAAKVTEEISAIRGIPVGTASISPNRHPEINNAGELLDFVNRVREVTGKPTGFKTVISGTSWLADVFAEIHQRGLESAPDFITIDSADGGTGASPMSLIDNMGLPIWETLPMVADELIRWDLKDRIKLICSGKMVTPTDVAYALCAGADFVVTARGYLFSLGCIQALQCNKNTCPTGITTHDHRLQAGLVPEEKKHRVAAYAKSMRKEIGIIAHSCGVSEPRQLRRHHVRIQTDTGKSIPLDKLWPYPKPGEALKQADLAA